MSWKKYIPYIILGILEKGKNNSFSIEIVWLMELIKAAGRQPRSAVIVGR